MTSDLNLPDQIVAGITPILTKYGITDKQVQGHLMVDMGRIFREINSQDVTAHKNQKRFSQLLYKRTLRVLHEYGITDMLQRAKCAQEMLEFVAELIKKEMGNDGNS